MKGIYDIVVSLFGVLCWLIQTLVHLLVIGFIGCAVVALLIYIKVKPDLDECRDRAYDILVNIDESDFIHSMDTYVYDKDGSVIGLINSGYFEYVPISEISMNIQNAYICQEDKRFKEHSGVDWISTIRAGLALVKNQGEITQGGSTITQQVIKNTYLTQERSFTRKVIEVLLAPQLEQKFSKAKIMEFYCNTNYYGNRCYGVQAASQYYFGKNASDLTLGESAILVGLSNSPSAYDPVVHYEASLEKRDSILKNLYENGFITEEEKDLACAEVPVIVQKADESTLETYQSSYAIHCAALQLMEQDGFSFQYTFEDQDDYDSYMKKYEESYAEKSNEIRNGGYSIYTSLDSEIQEKLQESVDTVLEGFTELQENGKYALQGAAAVADNESGYVVAIVGGRGTEDQFNRAYLSARQPGSSIKPLIDYTPAFDTGAFYPSRVMNDHEIENGPKNSGGSYRGVVTIREAVNRSINTVAWQVLQEIGVNKGLAYLGEMNFHKISYVDNDVAALAIGGFTNGVRIVDMAKGYQTLANYGEYNSNTCILDIQDISGKSLIANAKTTKKQVYEKDSAYLMTDILKGTMTESYGTGYGLGLNGITSAGKTGTTNSSKDTWFCGYTKYYSTAVWVGYDTPREMPGVYGSTYAGKIWQKAMNAIHEGLEDLDWIQPDTVYSAYYNPETGEETEAETGLMDLFSSKAREREEEYQKEKQNEAFLAEIERQVVAYENRNISGAEDTYSLEDDFREINNVIAQLEDTSVRMAYYQRISAKYQSLCETRESMTEEIALYESQKEAQEKKEAEEAKLQAEKDREEFQRKIREKEVETAIQKIEDLEYIPDSDDLVEEAKEKMELILDYDSYNSYLTRLQEAVEAIDDLPTKEEYQEEKEEEERIQREEAEKEEAKRQAELDGITYVEPKPTDSYEKPKPESSDSLTGPGV